MNVPAGIDHSKLKSKLAVWAWFVAKSKRKQIFISKRNEALFIARHFEFLAEPKSEVVIDKPEATNDSLLFKWQVSAVIQWYSLKWAENCMQKHRPVLYQYLMTVVNWAGQVQTIEQSEISLLYVGQDRCRRFNSLKSVCCTLGRTGADDLTV